MHLFVGDLSFYVVVLHFLSLLLDALAIVALHAVDMRMVTAVAQRYVIMIVVKNQFRKDVVKILLGSRC